MREIRTIGAKALNEDRNQGFAEPVAGFHRFESFTRETAGPAAATASADGPPVNAALAEFEFDYFDIDGDFDPWTAGAVWNGVVQRLRVSDSDDDLLEQQNNAETTALIDPVPGDTNGFEAGETVAYFGTLTTTFANGDVVTFLALSNFSGSGVQGYAVLSGSVPVGVAVTNSVFGNAPPSIPYASLQGISAAPNTAPTLTGFGPSVTFAENTVNAAPQLLDADVSFADAEGNFDGGTVSLSGLLAEDRAGINNQGTAAGQIGVSGIEISYGGIVIGSFAGGNGTTLTVTLNAAATSAAVDALIQNLTYANVSNTPTATRSLVLNVTDAGGESIPGTTSYSAATPPSPFNTLDVGTYSGVGFVDLDGDGDLDAVATRGGYDGPAAARAFTNNGNGTFTELTGSANPFNAISLNGRPTVTFVDVDGDGLKDAVFGTNFTNELNAFKNNGPGMAFTDLTGASDPFSGIVLPDSNQAPTAVDFDADGDLDIVVASFSGSLQAIRNNGDNTFTLLTGADNPFDGINPPGVDGVAFLDFDGDGDLDLIVASGGLELLAYRNNGVGIAYTPLTGAANPFAGELVGLGIKRPASADLDGDGDLDLLIAMRDGTFRALRTDTSAGQTITVNVTAQNDSPVANPDFFLTNEDTPIQISHASLISNDTDADGHTITLIGEGPVQNGTFTSNGGIVTFTPNQDFVGDATFDYEISDGNGGTSVGRATITVSAVNDAPTLTGFGPSVTFAENTVNAAPQLLDADVDFADAEGNFDGGTLRLSGLLAEDRAGINDQGTGAGQIGVSGTTVTYEGVAIGSFAGGVGSTLIVTLNAAATSAAVDALIQNLTYANVSDTPTASRVLRLNVTDAAGVGIGGGAAEFSELTGAANPFAGIVQGFIASPRFLDLDGDGDLDAVVGDSSGLLRAFRNDGPGQPFTELAGAANPFNGIDVGSFSRPGVVDLDGDGDLDLLVSNSSPSVFRAFRNNGPDLAFTEMTGGASGTNPFAAVTGAGYGQPGFVDLDGDGDLDAVSVGHFSLSIRSFRNDGVGVPVVELTGAANPFDAINNAGNNDNVRSIDFVDLDGDGDLDAVMGIRNGTLRAFQNNGANQPFTELTGAANPFDGLDVGSYAPIGFVDLDGDGDLDAVIGEGSSGGVLRTFENTGGGQSITVNVTAESDNVAPVAVDDSLAATEDTAITYTAAQLTGNDTDADGDTLTIASVTAVSGGTVVLNGDGTVTFTPDADYNGDAAFDYVVSDGNGETDTGRATVSIAAVNDAPTVTIAPAAPATTVDTLALTSSIIHSWGDGPQGYYGQLFEAEGSVLSSLAFLLDNDSGTTDYSVIVATVTFDGNGAFHPGAVLFESGVRTVSGDDQDYTLVEIDTGSLALTPGASYVFLLNANAGVPGNGYAHVGAVRDGSLYPDGVFVYLHENNGSTGADFASNGWYYDAGSNYGDMAFRLTFEGGSAGTLQATEQVALDLKGTISVGDVDAGDGIVTATLSVGYGVLDIAAGSSGATIVSGNGSGSVVVSGTIAQLNALLGSDATSSITYTADTDAPPASTTLTVSVDDGGNTGAGGALTGSDSETIFIAAVNDAPAIDLNGAGAGVDNEASYSEQAAATILSPLLTLSDADDVNIESATVSITGGFIAGADYLTVDGATGGTIGTIVFSYSAATGVLALTGPATLAEYEAVLRQVGFESTSDDPGTGRTIAWTVNDGTVDSAVATSTITIEPSDDAPVAQPDGFATDEASVLSGNVFPDNGAGPDEDVDGPALSVSAVNGSATDVGQQIVLASGALLTLNADGSFDYDPNGAFNQLPGPASGASNLTDTDSFTYTLTGGNTVTVTIIVSGLDSDGDVLLGTPGADTLDGGIGSDTMTGFGGDDVYLVDDSDDVVIESAGGGNDTIRTSVDYVLGAGLSVETMTTRDQSGLDPIDLTGNELNNRLEGNAGVNTLTGNDGQDQLYGHGGDDILVGGAGNDLLVGGVGIDQATFAAASLGFLDTVVGWVINSVEGNDLLQSVEIAVDGSGERNLLVGSTGFATIQAAFDAAQAGDTVRLATGNYTGTHDYNAEGLVVIAQPNATQNLTYTTSSGFGIIVYGANGVDMIRTGEGDDFLIGGGGNDTLAGGNGNDIYVVENAADQVFEAVGEGNDVVYALVSYQLTAGSEVERLSAVDWSQTDALDLTGNGFANLIEGNAGVNVLNGAGGADVMIGFGGDDIYVVDDAGDVVIEAPGGGNDVVYALAGYALTMGSAIERLSAIDWSQTDALDLTGNELANLIEGNAGVNVLNGAGGADTLVGFGGDDIYVVDNAGDVVIESAGGGSDVVYALANYTLNAGADVERLSSIDWSQTTALNLTGNELANLIEGNAGANVIDGGGGNDVLVGFGGADTFAFTTALGAGNVDLIADFSVADDTIALDDAVFTQLGGPGALSASAFVTGTAAADADDRIIYNSATGQLFYDADGNGAGAAVLFATLQGAPVLTASDFMVI